MKIYLGNNGHEEIYRDLDEVENIVFCGTVASGKTTYIERLLKEISENNTPDDVKVLIYDSKGADYYKYSKSPFLLFPITTDAKPNLFKTYLKAIQRTENSRKKSNDKKPTFIIFIDETSTIAYKYHDFAKDVSEIMALSKDTNIHFVIAAQRAICLTKPIIEAAKTKICGSIYIEEDTEMMIGEKKEIVFKDSGDVLLSIGEEKMNVHLNK